MEARDDTEWTAPLVEWSQEKGYGFLQVGGQRLFLHRRELIGPHRSPAKGDIFRFQLGMDEHGRACAVGAINLRKGLGVSFGSLIALAVLLVLPVMAAMHLTLKPIWFALGVITLSILTYALYAADKQWAREGARRVPESNLHLIELRGGWPGAWLAQRRLRHKSSKQSYQLVFWLIIALWQFACYDALNDWPLTQKGQRHIKTWAPTVLNDLRELVSKPTQ